VEGLVLNTSWQGRRVFLTGHTGFMGGWLSALLVRHGARVFGYAKPPESEPSFFSATDLAARIERSTIADIRDLERLCEAIGEAEPEVVFHLAAQPLVRRAHAEPLETFSTNVMGTANLLEAVRRSSHAKAVLVVTTDKVYRNDNRREPYAEEERLGGREPYSASKAACEFVADAWRHSYLAERGVGVATIRAGNIFGGGDWAVDRLVPDAMRCFAAGQPLTLRHPEATRPWQHVLEPLPGYLTLAERLAASPDEFAEGWNFGPALESCRPVGEVARLVAEAWGEEAEVRAARGDGIFEERLLAIDCAKARRRLGWEPHLSLEDAVALTVDWHRQQQGGADMWSVTLAQIADYDRLARQTA
jgi:CDP-glucose 4,6-dehydratase